LAQAPQNVHSPLAKSTSGYPDWIEMIAVGQTGAHAPQRVHARRKSASASAQGGRSGGGADLKFPRKKLRRLTMDGF
jgi:hypothetical protein